VKGGAAGLSSVPGDMTWIVVSRENWLVRCSYYVLYDSKEEYYVSHSRCISLLRILTEYGWTWQSCLALSCLISFLYSRRV
jgi:hypothetical protein